MCKYMFIQAVRPTTVEMDLMFVSVVRFLLLLLLYSTCAAAPVALCVQEARLWIT